MLSSALLLLVTVSAAYCGVPYPSPQEDINQRIINGQIIDVAKVPYIAAILINTSKYESTCAGSLVANQYIVTAAHCFNR